MSINLSNFTISNFLANNTISDTWKTLLDFLNKEADDQSLPFLDSQRQTGTPGTINDNADLVSGNDGFFNQIYNDMIASLEDVMSWSLPVNIDTNDKIFKEWENYFWNESVSKLMLNYYFVFENAGVKKYEGDCLFINEDGTIDTKHSHGLIEIKGADVRLRVYDIRNADAGHSFCKPSELWKYVEYEEGGKTIKLRKLIENNLWVIPWYNLDGETYTTIRGEDLKLSVMNLGDANDTLAPNYGKYFLDFTRKYDTNESKWMRLLMPQYKRRVEVEDLNRNFWVIAQTVSAMAAYLFDPKGPYPKLIGGILNEILQLWENVLFMWSDIAILTKKQPDTVTKVVYISPKDLSGYLSYDDFEYRKQSDNYHGQVVMKFVPDLETETYVSKIINVLDRQVRNQDFEDFVIKYLRDYRKKFSNKNVIFIPVVRMRNYEDNKYSRIICPGIYRYFINSSDLEDLMEEEGYSYPSGETIDGVFRTDNIILGDTNPILLNCHQESFQSIVFEYLSDKVYKYDLSMNGFEKVIAGICERSDNTGYLAINKLTKSEELRTPSMEKVYGLVKPVIFAESLKTLDYCGAEAVNFYIEAYDLAKYYMETKNQIENDYIKIGEKDFIVYRDWYSEYESQYSLSSEDKIDKRFDENIILSEDIRVKSNLTGNLGYYLGELLSIKRDSSQLNLNVIALPQKFLQPTNKETNQYRRDYGHSVEQQIASDVQDDETTLINILKNTYDKWIMEDDSSFWNSRDISLESTIESTKWDSNQIIRVAYDKDSNPIQKNRQDVKVSNGINNNRFQWGIRHWKDEDQKIPAEDDRTQTDNDWEGRWKDDAWEAIDDLSNNDDMTEQTILFVSGIRNTKWTVNNNDDRYGGELFAKDGLLHHRYDTTASDTLTVNAAVRMPIGPNEAAYSTYPLNVSPTPADKGWSPWATGTGVTQLWRQTYKKDNETEPIAIPANKMIKDDLGDEIVCDLDKGDIYHLDEWYLKYKEKTLFIKKDDKTIPRFGRVNSGSEYEFTQYQILRESSADHFTEDNWLIQQNKRFLSYDTVYFEYSYNGTVSIANLNLPFSDIEDVQIAEENNSIKEVGTLDSICSITPCLDEAYKHIYQKYVHNYLKNIENDNPEIFKTITLNDLMNEDTGLKLRWKLFGWIRFIKKSDGEISKTYYHINDPYYYGNNEKLIKIIDGIVRAEPTIAGGFYPNDNPILNSTFENIDSFKSFIKVFCGITNDEILNEYAHDYYYYGSFANLYQTSPHTEVKNDDIYYEDRILNSWYGIEQINQLNTIYKNDSARAKFLKMAQEQFNIRPETWFDGDKILMYKKIAQWIMPEETGQSEGNLIELKYPGSDSPTGKSIKIIDKLCLTSHFCQRMEIYLFGPDRTYARRGITRYPYDVNTETPGTEADVIAARNIAREEIRNMDAFGKWPVDAGAIEPESTNLKDDRAITGTTIDELRIADGAYKIVSSTIPNSNYEKYKTRESYEIEKIHCSGLKPLGYDDLDFNNIWSEDV